MHFYVQIVKQKKDVHFLPLKQTKPILNREPFRRLVEFLFNIKTFHVGRPMLGRENKRDPDGHRARDEARRDEQPRPAGGHQRPPQFAGIHPSQL